MLADAEAGVPPSNPVAFSYHQIHRNRPVSGTARGLAGRNRLTDADNASPLIKWVHH